MHRDAATLQVVLEGVALPATKDELIAYAREQGADGHLLGLLDRIEDHEYTRLDEVGEELAPVQPSFDSRQPPLPSEESLAKSERVSSRS